MSEQSEREAYNEAAREDHEGKEREEMDRPMFTQRDMDAAVQGEREAIKAHLDGDDFNPANGYDWTDERYEPWLEGVTDAIAYIDSRGPSPAVDVMAVVRRVAAARENQLRLRAVHEHTEDGECYGAPLLEKMAADDEMYASVDALRSLVAASPKAERPAHKGESDEQS